jgi:hypothetical protein
MGCSNHKHSDQTHLIKVLPVMTMVGSLIWTHDVVSSSLQDQGRPTSRPTRTKRKR